jgi:chromosome segregation ATPase
MRFLPILGIIAMGMAMFGYVEIRSQAEHASLRADVARLTSALAEAEKAAEERGAALSSLERERQGWVRGTGKLADLEALILDKAAELALLESDRAVAEERADAAIRDLKEQVRSFTAIETDIASLDHKRRRLTEDLETVEQRLHLAEVGAAERQKRAETLDREIAGLAIRRETLLAKLDATERGLVAGALEKVKEEASKSVVVEKAEPSRPEPLVVNAEPPIRTATVVDEEAPSRANATRGLYQFSRLSATPDLPKDEVLSEEVGLGTDNESWVEDQYLLGLKLISSAERSSGTRELSDAVLALKAVLGEWTRDDDRIRWATARSDLGYALALLGKRQKNADTLEDAAEASREALNELQRDSAPMLWAAAKHHLGVSLGGLAELRADVDLWKESIESLESALAAFGDAGAAPEAKKVELRLREAYAGLPTTIPVASE